MKAILILDKMPKSCKQCRLCYNGIDCVINGWVVFADEGQTSRSSKCTLKPLPPRKEFDNQIPYEKGGWNYCIYEIVGGDE